MSTTARTLTSSQIRDLRDEALIAGDLGMSAVCDRALTGDQDSRRECAKVIRNAEAQAAD